MLVTIMEVLKLSDLQGPIPVNSWDLDQVTYKAGAEGFSLGSGPRSAICDYGQVPGPSAPSLSFLYSGENFKVWKCLALSKRLVRLHFLHADPGS